MRLIAVDCSYYASAGHCILASSIYRGVYVSSPLTFQQLILELQAFWGENGCVILQPLDLEVGAGTFHPATFLKALGPENWNSAYVPVSYTHLTLPTILLV